MSDNNNNRQGLARGTPSTTMQPTNVPNTGPAPGVTTRTAPNPANAIPEVDLGQGRLPPLRTNNGPRVVGQYPPMANTQAPQVMGTTVAPVASAGPVYGNQGRAGPQQITDGNRPTQTHLLVQAQRELRASVEAHSRSQDAMMGFLKQIELEGQERLGHSDNSPQQKVSGTLQGATYGPAPVLAAGPSGGQAMRHLQAVIGNRIANGTIQQVFNNPAMSEALVRDIMQPIVNSPVMSQEFVQFNMPTILDTITAHQQELRAIVSWALKIPVASELFSMGITGRILNSTIMSEEYMRHVTQQVFGNPAQSQAHLGYFVNWLSSNTDTIRAFLHHYVNWTIQNGHRHLAAVSSTFNHANPDQRAPQVAGQLQVVGQAQVAGQSHVARQPHAAGPPNTTGQPYGTGHPQVAGPPQVVEQPRAAVQHQGAGQFHVAGAPNTVAQPHSAGQPHVTQAPRANGAPAADGEPSIRAQNITRPPTRRAIDRRERSPERSPATSASGNHRQRSPMRRQESSNES